jgi:hypothetical protein
MSSPGSVVVVVIAVALLVAAGLLARSHRVSPWPAIVVSAATSGLCFTVGSDTTRAASDPSVATVVGATVGILTVAAAVLAQIPAVTRSRLTRLPMYVASAAIVIGAVGLVVNELA